MTAEQLSAYVRLPYKNLIKDPLPLTYVLSNFSGQNPKNHKGNQKEKLAKLC